MTDSSLRNVAGVVLLTALALAPLNYGSTRLIPFQTTLALAGTGAVAWLISGFMSGLWTLPPVAAMIGVGLIGIVAVAWLFFLPQPEVPAFTSRHLQRLSDRWPFSVVPRDRQLLLLWCACALGAWFALVDLAQNPTWRWSIAGVMVLSGGAVALLGLLQNATHARGIFWDRSTPMPGAFFGTFFHHTSAGGYLNTVWPLGFALALGGIRDRAESKGIRLVIYGSLVCAALILAAHSGHISRLPQVLAAVTLVAFTLWVGLWKALGEIRGLRLAAGIVCGLLLVAVLTLGATRLQDIGSRWNQLEWHNLRGGHAEIAAPPVDEWSQLMREDLFIASDHGQYPLGDRGASYATALSAIQAKPWFGWGPGGWTAAAAAYSADPFIRTFYLMVQFTHSDYLQTLVEWGVIGAIGWALIFPGAVVNAVTRLARRPSQDFIGAAAAAGLVAVLIQSVIDFPLQIPAIQFNAVALSALAWSVPHAEVTRASTSPFFLS